MARHDSNSTFSNKVESSESLGTSLGRLRDKLFDSKLARAIAVMVPLAGVGTLSVTTSEYADFPGIFSEKTGMGRTKNSISAVIAGQKLHGDSVIDLEVQKICFPDARVEGKTTDDMIDTLVDLATTSSHFKASTNELGKLKGTVEKSEFNWKVKESSQTSWEIARLGPKFDATLKLTVEDGKISGTYVRPGPNIDWYITGEYDDSGNVEITIDAPLTLSVVLSGTIQAQRE